MLKTKKPEKLMQTVLTSDSEAINSVVMSELINNINLDNLRSVFGKNRKGGNNFYTTLPLNDDALLHPGWGIYIWTTVGAIKLMQAGLVDKLEIKFGQYGSNGEAKFPTETIQSYWNSAPQSPSSTPVLIWAKRISPEDLIAWAAAKAPDIDNPRPIHVEKLLQNKWTNLGLRHVDGNGTEWFNKDPEEMIRELHQELYDTPALYSWPLRPSQQDCSDMIVKAANAGHDECLMAAIMRFGKNNTYLDAALRLAPTGNHLVLTYRPKVFAGLRDDIAQHVKFANTEYTDLVSVKNKSAFKLSNDKMSVVSASVQLTVNEVSGDDAMAFLKANKWDTVMVDECHVGTLTDTFKSLLKELNIGIVVNSSGTPFKTEATGDFCDTNSFFYGYMEQQIDKKNNICPDAVTLKMYVIGIDPKLLEHPAFTKDERFSLNKLFTVNKKTGKFVYSGEVTDFVRDILGKNMTKRNFTPARVINENGDNDTLDHTYWLLPGVKECEAMAKLINAVAPEYDIVLACDNHVTDVDKAKAMINASIIDGRKTITLSCQRFAEGTSFPMWNATFHLSDTQSVEKYWQSNFRGCTPAEGKDVAYIFDFSPQRSLEMTFEMIRSSMKKSDDTDSQEKIAQFIQLMPIYGSFQDISDPKPKEISAEAILEHIRTSDYTSATIATNYANYLKGIDIDDADLAEQFNAAKPLSKVTIKVGVVDNDYEGAKTKIVTREPSDKKEKNEMEELLKKIVAVVTTFPAFAEIYDLSSVEEILEEVDEETFLDVTSVRKAAVQMLIDAGKLDTKWINFRL